MTTRSIDIKKSGKAWSWQTSIKYADFPNPAITNGGSRTLRLALADTLDIARHTTTGTYQPYRVTSLTVNGKAFDPQQAIDKLRDWPVSADHLVAVLADIA